MALRALLWQADLLVLKYVVMDSLLEKKFAMIST